MMHILVVEPDIELARVIQDYFASTAKVVICHNAQTAISKADTKKPDLVVLELAIAQHNGVAFLQEFRSYVDWAHIPVVIYSQIPREDTGLTDQQWGKLGVSAYLYKPTATLSNLAHAVDRAVIHETA